MGLVFFWSPKPVHSYSSNKKNLSKADLNYEDILSNIQFGDEEAPELFDSAAQ